VDTVVLHRLERRDEGVPAREANDDEAMEADMVTVVMEVGLVIAIRQVRDVLGCRVWCLKAIRTYLKRR
jgi:hypothetical protein